ncbi:outer membrane lipoprotein carrier protein LolA [Dongshaea marina]|uniref:outer membrane lipoprotein carrier protein LolA n=1 Tax=Dongshaea marina TaxID=2047966 RepID=UPI000D3E24D5|nr:outer membrane lipoprotein carrier protein LolA [Dongshaea marina]
MRLILGLMLLCWMLPVQAKLLDSPLTSKTRPELEQIGKRLAAQPLVRGKFQQVRNLRLLTTPLQSDGSFVLARGKGLIWQQTEPFASLLTISKTKMLQQIQGQAAMEMTAKENPMVFSFARVFLSLFDGNLDTLSNNFDIFFEPANAEISHWTLGLIPNQSPLNKAIKLIRIRGDKQISGITIDEAKGDKMQIRFTDIMAKPTPLNPTEEKQLAPE